MNPEDELLKACDAAVTALECAIPGPVKTRLRDLEVWRYDQKTDRLMAFLKCVSALSAIHAARLLRSNGHLSEMAALCRVARDCVEDVFFILLPETSGYRQKQDRHVEEYFQKEVGENGKVADATIKRSRLSRNAIHAAIANEVETPLNSSDVKKNFQFSQKMLSGPVHASMASVMDMYGGEREAPGFHFKGIKDSLKQKQVSFLVTDAMVFLSSATVVAARRWDQEGIADRLEAAQDASALWQE